MAEIVNLRQARKRKARAERQAEAELRRATFGRPKGERTLTDAERLLLARRLEAHRRDDPATGEP
jgi:hypothetical protein